MPALLLLLPRIRSSYVTWWFTFVISSLTTRTHHYSVMTIPWLFVAQAPLQALPLLQAWFLISGVKHNKLHCFPSNNFSPPFPY